jgi:protein tyrosine/serine phosphatase
LAKLGVKTVIDLREGPVARQEKKVVEKSGMRYVHIPMAGFGAPTEEQLEQIFKLYHDSASWPLFIHCRRGADRTGTVIACYRIAHDHWPNQKALEEAQLYGMSVLEHAMRRFVLSFQPNAEEAFALQPGSQIAQPR